MEGLAVMEEKEREKVMQMCEAAVPGELRDRNIVTGKAMIEKLVEERAFEKERKKKVRLMKEEIRRKFFQQGSGPGDILNFGMYEGWRFGDVYICHPTYGEWATDQPKPKMRTLKCFKFFLKRLSDLERVLQKGEKQQEVNITRVEMCENLMEEMVVEEQEVMLECKMVEKQRVRWADMEDGRNSEKGEVKGQAVVPETETERWVEQVTATEEERLERERERRKRKRWRKKENKGMKGRWRQIKKSFTEKKIGSAWKTKKKENSGGKSGIGRVMLEH